MIEFSDSTKPCSDLKCKKIAKTTSKFHIKLDYKKCKRVHSTVQAENVENDSLYPAD